MPRTEMRQCQAGSFARSARGASLLDELVAVVVLSIGLLGLAGLQGRVTNAAAKAENEALALTLVQSRIERLRGMATEPGGGGYARIIAGAETLHAIGEQHLETPLTLRLEVQRFRVQDRDGGRSFIAVADDAPPAAEVPEFKRVTASANWTGRDGVARSVALPAVVSPGSF